MKVVLYVDGASRGNPGPAGIGIVLTDPAGGVLEEIADAIGTTTNNVAEYRALLRGLEAARAHGADEVEIRSDSQLLTRQVAGQYKVRSAALLPLHEQVMARLRAFRRWEARHVPRDVNARADALANGAIDATASEAEYALIVEERGGGVVARIPALGDLRAEGRTRTEAIDRARALAETHLVTLRRRGEPWPREERIRLRLRTAPESGAQQKAR